MYTATMLMRSVWVRGRHRHLCEPWEEVFHPVPPDWLLDKRGIRHHMLADLYHPLAATGEQQTVIIRSANFEPPTEKPDE